MPFTPSPAQQKVIDHRGSDLQVIACAGSGKTESVSRRVADLVADGAEPRSIVAFTFTEKAAAELKERIVRRVEDRLGSEILDTLGPMFVGTIHSYCFRILQDHVSRYGNYDVLDDHRHAGLLSREYHRLGLSRLGRRHWAPIRDFIRNVDVIGNELIAEEDLAGTPIGECYEAYREMLDQYHFLTFSQLISTAVRALEDTIIFARVHDPLRYLIVDEYQDINPAQERLIELLSEPPVELAVVGDDDQSIYQWRGADVENILEFTTRRPSAKTVELTSNRRSRPSILSAANAFAETIPDRLKKEMQPVRPPSRCELVAWCAETEEDEADVIADAILELHNLGYRYQDVGVLFRSVRTSASPLLDALDRRGIPVRCAGRTGLFLQPEVALFGELFVWLADGSWRDERFGETRPADLAHVVDELDRRFDLGEERAEIRKYLEDWKKYRLRSSRPVSLVGDYYRILDQLGVSEIDPDSTEGSARLGALARFSQVLADFEHVNRRGRWEDGENGPVFKRGRDRGKSYFRALANYLLHYARDAYEDFEGEQAIDLDAVHVLTVHQAKGLEWPIVFVPALVAGRFPSRLAGRSRGWVLPSSAFPEEKRRRYDGSEAEERRLFYVAMTRARDCLYLSYFERRQRGFRASPFLREVTDDPIPNLSRLPLPDPPAVAQEDLPPTLMASFTDIATFDECGYRYRLNSTLGYARELAVELGYGKALHHVLRRVAEDSSASGEIPDADDLARLIDDEFYLPFADAAALERMHKAATRLVDRYVSEYPGDLARIWAVERPFELHTCDGTIAGRADVILDEEDGRIDSLAVVDYKVARDDERQERYEQQLQVYTAAGRGEGLDVEAAYLHSLSDGRRHKVDTQRGSTDASVNRVARSLASIRAGKFPPDPEERRCERCDYRLICRHSVARKDQS